VVTVVADGTLGTVAVELLDRCLVAPPITDQLAGYNSSLDDRPSGYERHCLFAYITIASCYSHRQPAFRY
jgi:hypothetical protein